MRQRADLTLQPEQPGRDGERRARVMAGQVVTPLVVTGDDLAAAIDLDERTLLFVAYGDPYEESLAIYLVDREWRILDQARLAAMGANGRFGGLSLMPPDEVRFHFFAGRPWRVRVFDGPRWRLPLPSLGLGLWRPTAWSRWFAVAPV